MNNEQPSLVNVLGVGLSTTNLLEATKLILDAITEGRRGYVCVTGVHGVTEAQDDTEFRSILNNSLLNVPDGMPMSWVGWIKGHKTMDRVYGPDLMLEVSEHGIPLQIRHFYYGGKSGVASLLKDKMTFRFPGLNVVGTYTPPFRPLNDVEIHELKSTITELKPDIVWIGLSTPKQEKCAAEFFRLLEAKVFIAVGAAFDFHAGLVSQSPRWMQRAGLEWFFRLIVEPKRLWKRYLINNPLFILRIFLQLSGIRKYKGCNDESLKLPREN